MEKKSIILSSAGLQNIVQNIENDQNNFCFIFGQHKLIMNNIFAEFLSPTVSRLHKTDPTINSIEFDSLFNKDSKLFIDELFNEEILSLLQKISRGFPIEIDRKQGFDIQLLSIIINNDDLFKQIDNIYPFAIDELNVDYYLQHLLVFQNFMDKSRHFNFPDILNFIASHFYSIDKNKLLELPKSILYSIISNEYFKIINEDSLLDFINQIFSIENDQDQNALSRIDFYEKVEFLGLSESKFHEFLNHIKFDEMTTNIWRNLCKLFLTNFKTQYNLLDESRYIRNSKSFHYDNKTENSLYGIIHYLTVENGGNVELKGIVKVTSSTIYNEHHPKTVADFYDITHFFESQDKLNSWVKYDFLHRRVRPTHYTIRSRNAGKGSRHLKNWVIEGSNSNTDNDWKVLDFRNDITTLDAKSAVQTFDIQNQLKSNESFRYLRIRQTGVNTSNDNFLTLSALEYFGVLEY